MIDAGIFTMKGNPLTNYLIITSALVSISAHKESFFNFFDKFIYELKCDVYLPNQLLKRSQA